MNEDKLIVKKVLAGDAGSFETLAKTYLPKIVGYLYKMGLDAADAKYLASDICVRAYDNLYRYDEIWDFSAWFYKIAARCLKDFLKQNGNGFKTPDLPEFLRAPGNEPEADPETESLNSILSSIHTDDRSMLVLRYYSKLPYKAIGRIYGLSAESAVMVVRKAREQLMRNLTQAEGENTVKCRYNRIFIVKYNSREIESPEKNEFENHLKTCLHCNAMLEFDSNLIKLVRSERAFGDIPLASVMGRIDKNRYKDRESTLNDYFSTLSNKIKLWRVAAPVLFVILLALLLAVPDISKPFWGGFMSIFNRQALIVNADAGDSSGQPAAFSESVGLRSGNDLVGMLDDKGMGAVPWQVLYGDPNKMFVWNGSFIVGYRDGAAFQAADLEALNLNHALGSIVTEFSFSTTGDFFIAGNSLKEGDPAGEYPGAYLFDTENGKYLKISDAYLNQVAYAWSIGGNYLAYADKKAGSEICILDLRTLKLTKIANDGSVADLFISNSGGVAAYTGDAVMMSSPGDGGWKAETYQNEPFYADYESKTIWSVVNGVIIRHVMGSDTDTAMKPEPPAGIGSSSDTFISDYRVTGNFLTCRLKNGDTLLMNLRTGAFNYLATSCEIEGNLLPWCDATPQGMRLMFDNDGKFLISNGKDMTTVNIPGFNTLNPAATRWIDEDRIAYVRMVDEASPKAGEFSLYTIDTSTGDIKEVFRSVASDPVLNTPKPGSTDSLSTKPAATDGAGKVFETDKATGSRVESIVTKSCKMKSGPGDNYSDIGSIEANEIVIYNTRVVNGWCLAQKVSGMLDFYDKTRNAFWIKADSIMLYDRYSLPVGVITAEKVTVTRTMLVKGNLIRIISKGDKKSYVIPDTTDANLGITGWIDNSEFTQETSGVYSNQAYLKKGSSVYSGPDGTAGTIADFTDFMAKAGKDVFVNLSGQSENGYSYVLLPGGMSGWVRNQDLYIPGGQGSSTPTDPTDSSGSEGSDLNSDGIPDEISFSTDGQKYILAVNDAVEEGTGEQVQTGIKLVDIDPGDGITELVVEDYGPSDDYISTFYYYDGRKLILMGQVQGLCDNKEAVAGNGMVLSQTRGSILETWFYTSKYVLNGQHKLFQAPQTFNEKIGYKDSAPLKILVPELSFMTDPGSGTTAFVLKQGDTVRFMGSNNQNWCLFETPDGGQGWLQISGFQDIPSAGITASEAFEGLNTAD